MKPPPKLDPGWEYLYKLPKGTIIELYPKFVVKVFAQDGTRTIVHGLAGDYSGSVSSFTIVKLPNNNKKEKNKNEMPKLPSNTNKRGTKA